MDLSTSKVWEDFYTDLYFFTLRRVKNKDVTNDILQNSFIKIHRNLNKLQQPNKVRQWVFQITRNEIANFHKGNKTHAKPLDVNETTKDFLCCFDRFVEELPEIYKAVILPVYFQGKKQAEVAKDLGISLPNLKARIRRAKHILKERFTSCCKYVSNEKGQLIGEPDCAICN